MRRKKSTYPANLLGLLARRLLGLVQPESLHTEPACASNRELRPWHRSLFVRCLDCGSCNGCELELNALSNPVYDCERYGIRFEASPLHADVLVVTGAFTRNLIEAAELTLSAMSEPKRIVTVGDCTQPDGLFAESYAIDSMRQDMAAVCVGHVPGCPPTPTAILDALLRLDQRA